MNQSLPGDQAPNRPSPRVWRRFLRLGLAVLGLSVLVGAIWFWRAGPDPGYRAREVIQWRRYRAQEFRIADAAARHGLDPHLVRAVVWRESRFHPDKLGSHGERGLMQVGEAAARDWQRSLRVPILQPTDLFDPHTNLEVGCWYLGRAVKRWTAHPTPEAVALAEYNAGLRRARVWADGASDLDGFLGRVDVGSTRAYVAGVLGRRDFYRARERAGRTGR